ncbi:hypothetical protein NHQ30_007699 [Ciborinia camelliae]|nr:hypothetical protein NHQ30_007699 [Ciborinia camelliae]
MASSTDNVNSNDMEIEIVANTTNASTSTTPFSPPAGSCDVGDIIRHGKDKWMILGNDQEWHEGEGPEDSIIKFCNWQEAEFFRLNDHPSGYRKDFNISDGYNGYIRWDEQELDAEFEKYKIQHEDETTLKGLLDSMSAEKVKPTNVACFALGSLHFVGEKERSFEQLAVLLEVMELLEIPQNARKVMQDPGFSPGDARFFERHGFQTLKDPEGINAVDENTLVFHVGGYDDIDRRIMDRPWPAMFINMWGDSCNEGKIIPNKSKVRKGIKNWYIYSLMGKRSVACDLSDENIASKNTLTQEVRIWCEDKKKIAMISEAYHVEKVPKIGKCDGMRGTQLFWRKERIVRGSFWWFAFAKRLKWAVFQGADYGSEPVEYFL